MKLALQFESDISVEKNGNTVSGKSIMGLMTLAACQGTKIRVLAAGPDATEALDQIERLFESEFDMADEPPGQEGA